MATQAETKAGPVIIIKRKRVVKADGHHGGAWKVAYADFVTAMMAFFLLMWLLNATTEEQRKGISDYFNPTIPISRISGGGSDGLNGSSIFTEDTLAKMGTGAARHDNRSAPDGDDTATTEGQAAIEAIAKEFQALKQEMETDSLALSEHLLVKITPEGLLLEIADSEKSPLFSVGDSQPSPILLALLSIVSDKFSAFSNAIKLTGHTDSRAFRATGGYDNWGLSFDRANVARELLVDGGLAPARIVEVSGRADTDPLIPENPLAAQNRRISIAILLK